MKHPTIPAVLASCLMAAVLASPVAAQDSNDCVHGEVGEPRTHESCGPQGKHCMWMKFTNNCSWKVRVHVASNSRDIPICENFPLNLGIKPGETEQTGTVLAKLSPPRMIWCADAAYAPPPDPQHPDFRTCINESTNKYRPPCCSKGGC